jgi:hypothetical protein
MEATFTPEMATMVRKGSSRTANGSSCYFVFLTPTTGLKLYATALERDASYVALSVASEHGLAPKVGQCIDLDGMDLAKGRPSWWPDDFKPTTLYGFLTEIAEPARDAEWDDIYSLRESLETVFDKEVGDMGGGNLGYLPNGKLVAIDIDGRFSGLLSDQEIHSINKIWGGDKSYWWA